MKKFYVYFLLITSLCYGHPQLEEITYESLANNEFTDHVRAFKSLFDQIKIRTFLELGVGHGTKFFLDNCDEVTSVELLIKDRRDFVVPWYCNCLELFASYDNWRPSLHAFSNRVNNANELAIQNRNPENYGSLYLEEMEAFLQKICRDKRFDLAFVDPGMHIRGDFVNLLFGKTDIIAAHDTNFNSACYGWYKIKTPETYTRIHFPYGSGITFWVLKKRADVIAVLTVLQDSAK